MAKKTKPQDKPDPQIENNPAIDALAEILPQLEYIQLIEIMSFVMKEVSKRHAND
jgi:hypothetical protein